MLRTPAKLWGNFQLWLAEGGPQMSTPQQTNHTKNVFKCDSKGFGMKLGFLNLKGWRTKQGKTRQSKTLQRSTSKKPKPEMLRQHLHTAQILKEVDSSNFRNICWLFKWREHLIFDWGFDRLLGAKVLGMIAWCVTSAWGGPNNLSQVIEKKRTQTKKRSWKRIVLWWYSDPWCLVACLCYLMLVKRKWPTSSLMKPGTAGSLKGLQYAMWTKLKMY